MSSSPARPLGRDAFLAARSLWLNRSAGIAAQRLAEAGIPCILLKGAVIATWLYDEGELRPYRDVDLLVPPSDAGRAVETLAELGYVHMRAGAERCEFGALEKELEGPDGVCIDLHHGLIGVSAPPERAWQVLSTHVAPFRLTPETEVSVLDVPARTMHLALHAAQDGPIVTKAIEDLRRGLKRVGADDWRAAAAIAKELGATPAFAAGLRLVPAGAVLAAELSLPQAMTVELAIRATSAPQEALVFVRLSERDMRGKLALVARKLFPTAAYLRSSSRLANRGFLGLVAARAWRLVSLLARLGPACSAWWRARRVTTEGADKR